MSGKPAAPQDRGFERELRRQADAHLLLGRRRPGLVVEDGVAAVGEPLDAVGARAERERRARRAESSMLPRISACSAAMSARRSLLEAGEPARDAQKARPPERARLRIVVERGEMAAAELDQRGGRIVRQLRGIRLGELADRAVDERAAIGGAGRHVDRRRARAAAGCAWRRSCRDRAASARSR